MKAIHKKRLLNVAKALRESPEPARFTMEHFAVYECGSPACALGHYAARPDLQKTLKLRLGRNWLGTPAWQIANAQTGRQLELHGTVVRGHFGITEKEAYDLFGPCGCNDAQAPTQAAKYIERFVEKHS